MDGTSFWGLFCADDFSLSTICQFGVLKFSTNEKNLNLDGGFKHFNFLMTVKIQIFCVG